MGKILIILISLLLCYPNRGFGQQGLNYSDLKKWQVRGYSRSALRVGDQLQASVFLAEWHRLQPENEKVKMKLARSLYYSREYEEAGKLFYSIYSQDTRANIVALFYYGMVQLKFGNYERALEYLEIVRRRHRALGGSGIDRHQVEQVMAGCLMAIATRDSIVTAKVERLDRSVNCSNAQLAPIIVSDTAFIYGSVIGDMPATMRIDSSYRPSRRFYKAILEDGTWQGGHEATLPFLNSSTEDTGRGAFSIDRKRFYSARCIINHKGKSICNLYMSRFEQGKWNEPERLGREINHPRFTTTQPTVGTSFSSRFEVIYFVSNRPGGAGGMDIWYSVYDRHTSSHRRARNAGVFINTRQDEVTPFYDIPSRRLYFSSDGWPGFGGLDIFHAEGNMVTWGIPVNMGLPFNSSVDDLDFARDMRGHSGFLVSNRPEQYSIEGCFRDDDLFAFRNYAHSRVRVAGRLVGESILGGNFQEEKTETDTREDIQTEVLGNRNVSVQVNLNDQTSVFVQEIVTDQEGRFEVYVDPGMNYTIIVNDPFLLDGKFEVSTRGVTGLETINVDIVALHMAPREAIVIQDIIYEFDRAELTAGTKLALDSTLVALMQRYPEIRVEIAAHTDNIGTPAYNLQLSKLRAGNVVDYLISKGVCRSRLEAKGHGHLKPLVPNQHPDGSDNPEGRQLNRRTEFKIIGLTSP